jgi:hypothetical protein
LGVQSNAGLICRECNSAVAKCEKIPVHILWIEKDSTLDRWWDFFWVALGGMKDLHEGKWLVVVWMIWVLYPSWKGSQKVEDSVLRREKTTWVFVVLWWFCSGKKIC